MRNNTTVNAIDDLNRPKACDVGRINTPNAKEAEPQTMCYDQIQASVVETNPARRQTLKRETHLDPTEANRDPAQTPSNDNKPFHYLSEEDPLVTEKDDTHINEQELEQEDLMCTRDNHQPWIRPAVPNRYSGEKKKEATNPEEVQGIVTPLVTGETEAILEGKPGLIPVEPLLPNPTTHDDKNKYEIKEEDLTSLCNQSTQITVGEPQSTSNQEGPEKQQDPANSTYFFDLGSPTGCNVRSRKTSDKNFSHYYFTDRDIKSPNLRQHA